MENKDRNLTEQSLLKSGDLNNDLTFSWLKSKQLLKKLNLIPWFIKRITNLTIIPENANQNAKGAMIGFNQLLDLASKEELLELLIKKHGKEPLDVFGALIIIHTLVLGIRNKCKNVFCEELLLEKALNNSKIAAIVYQNFSDTRKGRAMICAFCMQILPILIMAEQEKEDLLCQKFFEQISSNSSISNASCDTFGIDPKHLMSLLMLEIGCNYDASKGYLEFDSEQNDKAQSADSKIWHEIFFYLDCFLNQSSIAISEDIWLSLNFNSIEQRIDLEREILNVRKKGHRWHWIY